MRTVIVDTDIIIDHTRGRSESFKKLLQLHQTGKIRLTIPTAVVMELFSGTETRKKNKLKALEDLLSVCQFCPLSYEIAEKAGFLARDFPRVPDAIDFIVAASALTLKAKLATRNVKHYKIFPGIEFTKDI